MIYFNQVSLDSHTYTCRFNSNGGIVDLFVVWLQVV